MARPIKAIKKEEGPIGYQSVTVRLPYKTIEALNAAGRGKRAEFIRAAIEEKLQRDKIIQPAKENQSRAN